ncbi:organic cation transporter protein [Anabrus simplex]|uniref:organic cation transporter protein n=1 Tax=Anabrus simplex TaxID=316456 RepID=UPI0034DCE62B
MLGPKKRVLGGAIMSTYNAVGVIAIGAIAWGLQSWRMIHVVIYSPAFLFISYIWLLPESIRWLLAKGKKERAKAIIYQAAKTNGVVLSEGHFKSLTSLQKLNEIEGEESIGDKRGILVQAVHSKVLMIRLLMVSFIWACVGFSFSGMTFNSTSLAGNKYVNFMLAGLIELPGHLLTYFGMDRLGRKMTLCGSLTASGICCLLVIAVPADKQWLAVSLYLLGKFSITTSYDVLYMYAAELFPTKLRHSMMSACSMLGGVGAIAAPQAPLLATIYESLPLIIFGGTALSSALLTLMLPETRGIRLPDTIEEAENLSKKKSLNVDNTEEGIQ